MKPENTYFLLCIEQIMGLPYEKLKRDRVTFKAFSDDQGQELISVLKQRFGRKENEAIAQTVAWGKANALRGRHPEGMDFSVPLPRHLRKALKRMYGESDSLGPVILPILKFDMAAVALRQLRAGKLPKTKVSDEEAGKARIAANEQLGYPAWAQASFSA